MIREAVFTTMFNLSVSCCVIDPNHTVIEHIRTLDYSSVKAEHDVPVWSNQTILTFLKSTAAAGPF